LPGDAERRKEHSDTTRALPRGRTERLLSRRDIPLREKTLCRMLYETAARASEILALNLENLDLERRRVPVRSKGRDSEFIYWDTGTAHLLPRLLRLPDGTSRTSGPLFLARRRPVPARRPTLCDICPQTGRARHRHQQRLELHQLRHSAATDLGDQEVPLQLIMAKTQRKSPRTFMRYVRPGDAAVAEVTSLLGAPRRSH
jgi:integrase